MIYKLIEDEQGEYIATDGNRYTILEAVEYIDTPEGRNVGCVECNSLYEFITSIGLSYVDTSDNSTG